MSTITIKDVRTIVTQPDTHPLVVVKVDTSEPGLYGLGCATFTQRFRAVQAAVDSHLRPLLVGRDVNAIEDIWHLMMLNGYWRNGPVLNNAVSGVDMALWDIKGKHLNVPCHDLWGGRSRPGASVYVHANGTRKEEVAESAQALADRGFRYIRCQLGGYQGVAMSDPPEGATSGAYGNPREKVRLIPELFEYLRENLPPELELLYDVHERVTAADGLLIARSLEPFRLFFLEDLFAPEDIGWFRIVRTQCATPLAMGELFVHPLESVSLISERLIDFIRVHVSTIGGITPALKLGHLCEAFGVRTAWHGPHDVSPVGMAANVHLDVHLHSFGIQEWAFRTENERQIFTGIPEVRDGYVFPNTRPGLGIDMDEKAAARYPAHDRVIEWTQSRLPDGGMSRP